MDLRHFFDGQQSRENAASAYLATLLEHDVAFRRAFLDDLGVADLDADDPWVVRVEDIRPWSGSSGGIEPSGSMDISLETATTIVVIENKLSPTAKRDGQLLQYYEQVAATMPQLRVVMVYLSPLSALAASELALVVESDTFAARSARSDAVAGTTWARVRDIVAASADAGWFATSGIRAVLSAIERAARGLPPDPQRDALHAILRAATVLINERLAPVRFQLWPSDGYADIMTRLSPVWVDLTVRYAADPDSSALVGVVTDAGVRVSVRTTIGLSTRGERLSAVRSAWDELTREDEVEIPGVGRLSVRGGRLIDELPSGLHTPGRLTDLLVSRAAAAIEFLRPCLTAAPQAGSSE